MSDDNIIKLPCCGPPCRPELKNGIGELAGRNGLTPYHIRKMVALDLVHCIRIGEGNLLFPETQAMQEVAQSLADNRVNGSNQVPPPGVN
jgi:hypothetical protein